MPTQSGDRRSFVAGLVAAPFSCFPTIRSQAGASGRPFSIVNATLLSKMIKLEQGRAVLRLPPGQFVIETPIVMNVEPTSLLLQGSGQEKTTLILGSPQACLRFQGGQAQAQAQRYSKMLHICDLSIVRPEFAQSAQIRRHSLAADGFSSVVIRRVTEQGATGWGITVSRSDRAIVEHCTIVDHMGGQLGPTGTDGINLYQCLEATLRYNTVSNVGDDPLSVGSYNLERKCHSFLIAGNRSFRTRGSIKAYGMVAHGSINNNTVSNAISGGVGIWDDRPREKSGGIDSISIRNNVIDGCGLVGACGGIFLFASQGPTSVGATSFFSNISIISNRVTGGQHGLSIYSEPDARPYKRFKRVYCADNRFNKQSKSALYNPMGVEITSRTPRI